MDVTQSIFFPLIILLSFASFVVAAVVYFRSEKEPEALQRRFLPRFYAYAMLFISSLILLIGGGLLLKAALSYPLGVAFSYRGQPIYAEVEPGKMYMEPPPFEGIEYRPEERLRDLLNGTASVVMGAIFLALHWVLRDRVESQKERPLSFLNKAYLMVSGVVYGGLSLVLLPMGLYQLIEFYFVPRGDPEQTIWSWPIPGDTLGYALVALVLWLWVLPQLFRSLGLEKSEE
ncbi:MAG: hypothetical protein MUP04_06830 [Anaerolineae bacterium]|nr:hypothetical protein [Anaerolineae bacterium]